MTIIRGISKEYYSSLCNFFKSELGECICTTIPTIDPNINIDLVLDVGVVLSAANCDKVSLTYGLECIELSHSQYVKIEIT